MSEAGLSSRRRFLSYLGAAPLVAQQMDPIARPEEAINLLDFEAAARKALPPAHFGYMATGVDGDVTLRRNAEAYSRIGLRPRRLTDVSTADPGVEIFGERWETPIFLCPVGHQHCFHPQGEVAVARAAKSKHHVQVLSTVTSTPVERIAQELGRPPWFQLYLPAAWADAEKLVRRVEEAGCPVLVWTIDVPGSQRNVETFRRSVSQDKRVCTTCHASNLGGSEDPNRRPMLKGLSSLKFNPPAANWETLDRLRRLTKMKIVLKGVETREDALLAREHGADGIIVSNHGGRAAESMRGTIESLPEVMDGAGPQMTVLIDGGVRRGGDVFKALALGAKAVGIGRPYIWGLSAFGQPGVERVLEMLRGEFEMTMRQCGVTSTKGISSRHVFRL